MKLHIALAASAIALTSIAAQAQQGPAPTPWYGELGYSLLGVRESTTGFKVNPQAVRGVVGYNVHPNFAVEGMLALGTAGDESSGVDIKVQHAVGVFVKPKVNVDKFELFGRLGWMRERSRVNTAFGNASGTDDDFAFGVGASYSFSPRTYVTLDYMRYLDKNSVRVDGWTLGAGYRF